MFCKASNANCAKRNKPRSANASRFDGDFSRLNKKVEEEEASQKAHWDFLPAQKTFALNLFAVIIFLVAETLF
jgi:hypothetical protein